LSRRGAVSGPGPDEPEKKEKCAVFGVWGRPDGVRLAYYGLYAQQHRGQESAGIADSVGERIRTHGGMGLVAEVFDSDRLRRLEEGAVAGAIGHNRYSTAGGSTECNIQPLVETFLRGPVAVAHNGNLVNASALRRMFSEEGRLFHTTSDTEIVIHLLASPEQQSQPDPVAATLRRLRGASALRQR
jgi:amidophosphoribosyltransferase